MFLRSTLFEFVCSPWTHLSSRFSQPRGARPRVLTVIFSSTCSAICSRKWLSRISARIFRSRIEKLWQTDARLESSSSSLLHTRERKPPCVEEPPFLTCTLFCTCNRARGSAVCSKATCVLGQRSVGCGGHCQRATSESRDSTDSISHRTQPFPYESNNNRVHTNTRTSARFEVRKTHALSIVQHTQHSKLPCTAHSAF